MTKSHKILACLPPELYDKVHARARHEHLSDSAFLVNLARQYMEHNPAPPKTEEPKASELNIWWNRIALRDVEFRDTPILKGPTLNTENQDIAPRVFKRFKPANKT